ncbi:MAG: LamG-like jellyroll fold domain-containing protein [Halobacteriota archaeon]
MVTSVAVGPATASSTEAASAPSLGGDLDATPQTTQTNDSPWGSPAPESESRDSSNDTESTPPTNDSESTATVQSPPSEQTASQTAGTLELDGRGYATAGDSPSLDAIGSDDTMSFEFWVKYDASSDEDAVIFTKGGIPGTRSGKYQAFLSGTGEERPVTFELDMYDGSFTSNSGIQAGQWTHVAFTYDGSTQTIYINGEQDAQRSESGSSGSNDAELTIGADDTMGGHYLDGQVEDLRFWNDARNLIEIEDNLYTELNGDEAGLAAHYQFAGDATDSAGANDLSLGGDATVTSTDANPVAPYLYATSNNGSVDLTWDERRILGGQNQVDQFTLYRSTQRDFSDRTAVTTVSSGTTSYTDTAVSDGQTYYYQVTGINSDGREGDFSRAAVASPYHERGGGAFNASGRGYGTVSDRPSLDNVGVDNTMSFEFWVKYDASSDEDAVIFTKGGIPGDRAGAYLAYLSGTGEERQVTFELDMYDGSFTSNSGIQAGQWNHVAFTYDGSTQTIYINGKLDAQRSESGWSGTYNAPLTVGADDSQGGHFLKGSVDNLRLWKDGRTESEITNNYQTRLTGNEDNLAASWRFDEVGTTDESRSAETKHGTVQLNGDAEVVAGGTHPLEPHTFATGGNSSATVTWENRESDSVDEYRIYRSSWADFRDRTQVGNITNTHQTSYVDSTVNNDRTYFYEVTAVVDGQESDFPRAAPASPSGEAEDNIELGYQAAGGGSLLLEDEAYATVSDRPSLDIGSSDGTMAIEFWVRHNGTSDDNAYILKKGDAYSAQFVGTGEERPITFSIDSYGGDLTSHSGIPADVWTHVAFTWDGDTKEIYINGELDAQEDQSTTTSNSNLPLRIGTDDAASGHFFEGSIDSLRLWSDGRTDVEIRENYQSALTGNEDGLAAYWRFNDDRLYDHSLGSDAEHPTAEFMDGADIDRGGSHPVAPDTFAKSGNSAATVTWEERDPGTATAFKVYRSSTLDLSDRQLVARVDAANTTYVDENVSNGQTYYYEVTAVDGGGQESDFPRAATATPYNESGGASLSLGGGSYATVSDRPSLDLGGDDTLTMEFWLKHDGDSDTDARILRKGDLYGARFVGDGEEPRVRFFVSGYGGDLTSNAGIPADTWTHVAFTWDGNTKEIYINGELDAQEDDSGNIGGNDRPLRIGTDDSASGHFFSGHIDELRLWNDGRTGVELRNNYLTELTGNEDGLTAYWRFDDVGANVARATDAEHSTAELMEGATLASPGVFPLPPQAYARGDDEKAEIAWSVRSRAASDRVNIYRATQRNRGDRTYVTDINASRNAILNDYNLSNGVTYYYEATTVDSEGQESDYAFPASVLPSNQPAGNAYELNGQTSYLSVTDRPSLDFAGDETMTLEFWINFEENSSQDARVLTKGDLYRATLVGTGDERQIRFDGDSIWLTSDTAIQANTWTHVAFTYDGNSQEIYINGALDTESSGYGTIGSDDRPLHIGTNDAANGQFVKGKVDQIRLWDDRRSGTEIRSNYKNEVSGNEEALVGLWRGCYSQSTSTVWGNAHRPMTATLTDVTCSPSGAALETGSVSTQVNVTLSDIPDGLQQYDVSVTTNTGTAIRTVTPGLIQPPEFQITSGGAGAANVSARGVDLTSTVAGSNDEQVLFTIEYAGNISKDDLNLTVNSLLDDSGSSMAASKVSLSTQSSGSDTELFQNPIGGAQAPPSDPDGDGLYEDVNGDGQATFDDAITLAFTSSGSLSADQIEALDFDGDAQLTFSDAIELAFNV